MLTSKLEWSLNLPLAVPPLHFKSIRKSYRLYVLNLSWSPLLHPISAGIGLMLIFSSFECSHSGLPSDSPHCCQCDGSEMEIWSFLCNSHLSLSSQSLAWSKILVGNIFENIFDLTPACFSDSSLSAYETSLLWFWTPCHHSKVPWVFTALQVASSIATAWNIFPSAQSWKI